MKYSIHLPEPDSILHQTHVHSAALRLYKHNTRPGNKRDLLNADSTVRVSIYQVLTAQNGAANPLRRLIDSKMVSLDTIGWEEFDVTSLVMQWKEDDSSNLGLLVICDSQPIREVIDFIPTLPAATVDGATPINITPTTADSSNSSHHQTTLPLLEVYTQEQSLIRRTRRSYDAYDVEVDNCRQGDGETRCCRYPLEVRFKDLGPFWDDFIITPPSFKAYFCDGSCPHAYKTANRFASIQSLMHSFNPLAVPRPCCSPTRLRPIQVLHKDRNGRPRHALLEDMIVEECGCS